MEPRIQYAKTTDGVSIAFWTLGEGPPLVATHSFPWSHIELEWRMPAYRFFYQRLAARTRLIRYDTRGTGCSQRDVADFSLAALQLDVEAVADRLQLDSFSLWTYSNSCPMGIRYAARNPQRISRLVLMGPFARGSDVYQSPTGRATRALRDSGTDWNTLSEAVTRTAFGFEVPDAEVRTWAMMLRECANEEEAVAMLRAVESFDVSDDLAQVQAPTLVLPNPFAPWPPPEFVRRVASGIPDARFMSSSRTPGVESIFDDLQAAERWAAVITDFVTEGEPPAAVTAGPEAGAFRTVLFTDLVGHTEMMSRLGDERGREVLREHERITREVLKRHGGTEVKTMGDGFMASFASVTKAVECAIALQKAFDDRNRGAGRDVPPERLYVRVGLNAGEPIEEDGDLFGATVILAARIAAKAEGGEILASLAVRELCSGKGFLFADRGEFVAKGFEEPVRVYEVGWRE